MLCDMTESFASYLSEAGPVARRMPRFELRPQQVEMSRAVGEAFTKGRHLIVEAGTGVGKSFAYLIPAIEQVVKHRKRVVISTHTISLQEQLIEKDIPFLQAVCGQEFSAVLCKGRSNYLCLRRLEQAERKMRDLFVDQRLLTDLDMIHAWSETTRDGSLSDMVRQPSWQVWDRVCAEHGNCLGKRCRYYQPCFYQASRRRMANGQILVCNHAMFFADLALRRAGANMLPEYDLVVLDEAHTLEAVASDHFGLSVSESQVRYLLSSLYAEKYHRGFLATLGQLDAVEAIDAVYAAGQAADDMFNALEFHMRNEAPANGRVLKKEPAANALTPAMEKVIQTLRGVLRQLQESAAGGAAAPAELREIVDNAPDGKFSDKEFEMDKQRFELNSFINRCQAVAVAIKALSDQEMPGFVYWLENTGRTHRCMQFSSSPIDVAEHLKSNLFEAKDSVILTSATLATGPAPASGGKPARADAAAFDYFRRRVGLNDGAVLHLGSPFDYQTQMTLYLETQLPAPDSPDFLPAAMQRAMEYIKQTEGRAFVLFTSYAMMDKAALLLEEPLRALGYPLLVQGRQISRGLLLRQFKQADHSVLLGTDTFWQGVDVPGDALSNVIITRLPFSVPDKPLTQARVEKLKAQGGNPFQEFSLPEAIIKFKQGFGRLIRTRTDQGIVVVLDNRLVGKAYGKAFLAALPPCRVIQV